MTFWSFSIMFYFIPNLIKTCFNKQFSNPYILEFVNVEMYASVVRVVLTMKIVEVRDFAIQDLAACAGGNIHNFPTIHESFNEIYFQITSNNLEIYQIYCNHFKKLIDISEFWKSYSSCVISCDFGDYYEECVCFSQGNFGNNTKCLLRAT